MKIYRCMHDIEAMCNEHGRQLLLIWFINYLPLTKFHIVNPVWAISTLIITSCCTCHNYICNLFLNGILWGGGGGASVSCGHFSSFYKNFLQRAHDVYWLEISLCREGSGGWGSVLLKPCVHNSSKNCWLIDLKLCRDFRWLIWDFAEALDMVYDFGIIRFSGFLTWSLLEEFLKGERHKFSEFACLFIYFCFKKLSQIHIWVTGTNHHHMRYM